MVVEGCRSCKAAPGATYKSWLGYARHTLVVGYSGCMALQRVSYAPAVNIRLSVQEYEGRD